jgi:WD40 repeat protein
LDYSTDGKLLVSASPDKTVLIWDTKKSSAGQKLIGHKDKVYCAKISENDKLIASVGEGGELLVWDVAKTK